MRRGCLLFLGVCSLILVIGLFREPILALVQQGDQLGKGVTPGPGSGASSSVSSSSSSAVSVLGPPSLSASFVDAVLQRYHSPAAGKGQALYRLSLEYGIDDVFALGFFWHESRFGTQGEAGKTLSLGNLRCIPTARCVDQERGGYAAFSSWEEGFEAWYRLIAGPVYVGAGLTTVPQIVHRYAPSADGNDERAYVQDVLTRVAHWRAGQWL